MQEELCKCCGKQQALTADIVEKMTARPAHLEITDEMRRRFPPEALRGLEQMQQQMAKRQIPADMQVGFCNMCAQAGCDGVSPCKVPIEEWEMIERETERQRLWEEADELDRRRRGSELGGLEETGSGAGEWEAVSEGYWRKETSTPHGTAINEVVHDVGQNLYEARVKLAEEPPPISVGNVTARHSAGAIMMMDLQTLEQAQAACEEMVQEIITEGPMMITDVTVGFGPLQE